MKQKYIYLVFSKTGTFLGRVISSFTCSKYAHVSISFDDSFTKMYSFGRRNPDNPFIGGFVEENIYDGVYKKFSGSECLICRVKVTKEQYDSIKLDVDEFVNNKDNLRYNFLGLLGVLFDKPLKRDNYYFCSQFVSGILAENNVLSLDKSPELIKPNDLIDMINGEIIYEGLIARYYGFNQYVGFARL